MKVCVTGGGGYVGTVLVPQLMKIHEVSVLDAFWYGDHLPASYGLKRIPGDIRRKETLRHAFSGQDAVIHLACVSNDPSFDMKPALGKSINYDCFKDMLSVCREVSLKRFIYASSSSVYGVSELEDVTEDSPKNPLTDYSKFKLACEAELAAFGTSGAWTIVRPATVCGYSPRMRLDLVVNLLTIQALVKKKMTIHGGLQRRPNINILDMTRAYQHILEMDCAWISGKTYNVGFENLNLLQIAELIKEELKENIEIEIQDVLDQRSYHVNSDKIGADIGFEPKYTIRNAIASIKRAYDNKLMRDPLSNPAYYNIKQMKENGLI